MNNSSRPAVRAFKSAVRAFTLIELLIVIGLTAVLFGLLLVPLVSAIRYTQQAQIVTAAQDAVRITKERLTRELGSALFVFDGTSHPFLVPGATPPQPGDDRYTNFLDLPLLDKTGTPIVAHAYAAKLDFAQPRANGSGGAPTDPTTGEPISYRPTENGSAIISNPAYVFPLAAGTTMTRYWVGLKDPSRAYNNTREGKSSGGSSDNTYILYRAQFQPYIKDGSGKTVPNPVLFAVGKTKDANGNTKTVPELDDPDFFRYVNIKADGTAGPATDTNWLDDAHGLFPAQTAVASVTDATADGSAAQHNYRVEKWRQIAKPVIPGPNVDLILLPHNADNTLAYDSPTGAVPGVAHSGVARDPVSGMNYPIVNTSVTFRPGTVTGDAVPGTTSDYGSQALPTLSGDTGYGYVPTFYSATSRSWSLPFHVSLYPGNYTGTQEYYATQISSLTDTTNPQPLYTAGDILEYSYQGDTDQNPKIVYNVSKGYPLKDAGGGVYALGGTDYVPFTVNPDNGTLNFGTPSLPNGPLDRNQRLWAYGILDTASPNNGGVDPATGTIDLTRPTAQTDPNKNSPLFQLDVNPASATGVKNAHIVPGGIRVNGPDTTPGPNHGQTVPYTEINSAQGNVPGENQYIVDYAKNTITVSAASVGLMNELLAANTSDTLTRAKIRVVYDYQANMTRTTDPTGSNTNPPKTLLDDPYLPMQVKLEYQTRDLIDVSIGVRIYDITNNRAQVIPAETKIKIGNSNR